MLRRALLAGMLGLLAAVAFAASVTPALAQPLIAVESPGSGTITKETHPTVSGFSSDNEDPVTVVVSKEGAFYETAEAEPKPSGAWSVQLPTHLEDGEYTVFAEQTEALTKETAESGSVSFTVDTQSPRVTLDPIVSPSKDSTPSFSGTASDTTDVAVYVFKGSSVSGSPVAEVTASGTGSSWSSGAAGTLADGTYTAIAEQSSSIGNEPGFSEPQTFEIHASKPKVSLNGISSPTSTRTPSFAGSASEESTVTIRVYAGGSADGEPVAEAQASGTGGSWTSGPVSPALDDGSYTAVAEQESEFGNGPGQSGAIHFSVETPAPTVSLEGIPTPSNDTAPSFGGFASEKAAVTVDVYPGGSAKGEPVRVVTATGTGGSWSSGALSPPLAEGSYTAVAEQKGAFGNGTGHSGEVHFTVITASPHVTLNSLKTPSGDTTPSFTGSASEKSVSVSILIYTGTTASGTPVSSAFASGTGGTFSSGPTSPALADGTYTAKAVQNSGFGNPPGESNPVTFTVDTSSPTVTLNQIASPSKNAAPTFTGTATDSSTVVVRVLHEGVQVATAEADPSAGSWKSGGLSKSLASGSYTASAEQASSLGNPAGKSEPISFVVNTASPQVKLNQPAPRSGDTTPSFSGTASDTTPVSVEVFKGGSLVRTVDAGAPAGGEWSSPAVSPALGAGTYTAVAVQPSSLENPAGHSETRTFEIDTSAPTVTVDPPAALSSNRFPAFSGTASESSTVHVHVLEGSTTIRELSATPSGGSWSTEPLSSPLATGHHEYKVFATQESTIGNGPGKSEELPFAIDTNSPVVSLEKLKTPSNVNAPTFHGTATDTLPVKVEIFSGAVASGSAVTTVTETGRTGNAWTAASPGAVGDGTYTAVAVEQSSLGNPPGHSAEVTFTIDTKAPAVAITPFKSPSNVRAPSFSGSATDTEKVVVQVLEAGTPVATAEATPSGGKWKTGAVAPELPAGEHAYTVVAKQKSSLGNPEGASAALPYVLNTLPPTVTIEGGVAESSANIEPAFNGSATDVGPVTVVVKGGGKEFKATSAVAAGKWATTPGSILLPLVKFPITYTVIAEQASSIGNAPGKTKTITFVVDPSAPSVTMATVKAQIGTPTPTFTGTAADTAGVAVAICRIGSVVCKAEHGESEAKSNGAGFWSATEEVPLADGEYEALAWGKSVGGTLGTTPRQTFTIDTAPPAVSVVAPSDGATVSGSSVAVHGVAGAAAHDVPSVTVQLFAGTPAAGGPLQTVTVPVSGGGWSAELGGLTPGHYTVRAAQSDEAGNVGVSQHSFTDIAPAASTTGPTAAFTWFPAHPHTGEPVTLVSTSSDATSPITSYAWNTVGTAFAGGAQSRTTTFASRGNHLVRLSVTDGAGRSSIASEQIPVSFPLMRPFPAVRIVTTRSGGRLRLKALTVEAPAGSTVTVACIGKGCPVRSLSRVVLRPKGKTSGLPSVTFPRLQRALPAGTALEIRVTQAGKVGKFTRFAIRKGKLPLRADACVNATEPKPVPCAG